MPDLLSENNKITIDIISPTDIIITADDISVCVIVGGGKMPESTERGALTEAVYYILLSLYQPRHGYGVMQNIKELSNGRVSLGAGTLYGAISTLLEKGWIEPKTNEKKSRKKEYQITASGKAIINAEITRLEELIMNGKRIIGG